MVVARRFELGPTAHFKLGTKSRDVMNSMKFNQ